MDEIAREVQRVAERRGQKAVCTPDTTLFKETIETLIKHQARAGIGIRYTSQNNRSAMRPVQERFTALGALLDRWYATAPDLFPPAWKPLKLADQFEVPQASIPLPTIPGDDSHE